MTDAAADRPEWEVVPEGWRRRDAAVKGWDVGSVVAAQTAGWPPDFSAPAPLGWRDPGRIPSGVDYGFHNTLVTFAYVLALASRGVSRISVLDWGGGLGAYALLGRAAVPDLELDFHVKELPMACAEGRRVSPGVTFHEDETCLAARYDLVLASGSLHYAEDWRSLLARLAGAAREWLFVTRLPVTHAAPSFVVVQRPYRYGYDTEYLGWFLNRVEFLEGARAIGLELEREFLVQERPPVKDAPAPSEYRGFLFHLRAGAP